MLPRIILHNAISLDGRINGFPIDLRQYYELAATWKEDATLAGSQTFLSAASEAPPEDKSAFLPPEVDPHDHRPLLVIPDSRGRIRTWHYLKSLPYWRLFVALCTESTPKDYLNYLKEKHVDCINAGEDRVDLRDALEELNLRYGVKVVRVDAGGTLNGLLLRQGLVSEVSRSHVTKYRIKSTPGPKKGVTWTNASSSGALETPTSARRIRGSGALPKSTV